MEHELTPEQLIEKLLAEVSKSIDARDTALIEKIGKQVDERMVVRETENAKRSASLVVPGLDPNSKEVKDYSFARLLRGAQAAAKGGGEDAMKRLCPMEYALHVEALKTKDMATSTDSAGGYLVPAQVMSAQMIPLLQEQLVLTQLGARDMSGLVGSPVEIPKRTSGTTAYWINHDITTGAAQPSSSDLAFAQARLTPKTVAARSRLSNRLISLSSPAAESVLRESIVFDLATAVETAAINGSGASGQPLGLLQVSGVNTKSVGSVIADTAYDALVSFAYELRIDNALMGNLGWLLSPLVFDSISKMKDLSTQPKARRLLSEGPIAALLGYKFAVTNNAPATCIVLGNWSELMIGRWGGLALKVDDLSVLGLLQTQVLASMDVDVQVRHAESFCVGTSVS